MLTKLQIESFKSYSGDAFPFQPLTVLVGPNGSGKTSALQAIEFLGALVRGTLPELLKVREWEYRDLPRLRAPNKQFGFRGDFVFGEMTLQWTLRLGARRSAGIAEEIVTNGDGETLLKRRGRTMERLDRQIEELEDITQTLTSSWLASIEDDDRERFPELLELATWARGVRPFIALDPVVLRTPSRRTDGGIGPRGENLAGFLRSIRDRSPQRFSLLVRRVRRSYPQLKALTLRSERAGWNRIEVQEHWGGNAVSFTASQVSDGLLRLIAVSAMHEMSMPPSVLMFDEIENGLHPHLLQGLVEMLQELADRGRTQIVVSTHSPVALNYVKPESVLIVNRDANGATSVTPLVETPSFMKLGSHLDAGELWYNLGERELVGTGGRPNARRPAR